MINNERGKDINRIEEYHDIRPGLSHSSRCFLLERCTVHMF